MFKILISERCHSHKKNTTVSTVHFFAKNTSEFNTCAVAAIGENLSVGFRVGPDGAIYRLLVACISWAARNRFLASLQVPKAQLWRKMLFKKSKKSLQLFVAS
jgi:hypothetical protein